MAFLAKRRGAKVLHLSEGQVFTSPVPDKREGSERRDEWEWALPCVESLVRKVVSVVLKLFFC